MKIFHILYSIGNECMNEIRNIENYCNKMTIFQQIK